MKNFSNVCCRAMLEDVATLRHARAEDGAILQYEVLGAGEPVIFLHGSLTGRDAFTRQAPLAASFRLILRDLRGHNGSEARLPVDYNFETTELTDLEAVLDAEGIERADLVAHSTGGAIAVAFARRHPERVRRLVLLEPTLLTLLPDSLRAEDRAARAAVIAQAEVGDPRGAARAFYDRALGAGWEARARPEMLAQMEAAAPVLAAHCRALLALDVTHEDVRRLAPSTLWVHGRRSSPVHAAISAHIGEIYPEAHRLAIEDAGHAMHLTRPQIVNEAILQFLNSQDGDSLRGRTAG
jgi:pimeloyl-ACP methyl ester carboxylesterase